ncbi:Arf GTPase activating protein [Corchorus olitorius]|uniref:Arf GTPase activating protein n=1 Tax=Corchorus olitorius TaxID=93759 RepID=A0A1R3ID28_9ROSI|nr:Arf GTPase activating protein [Corchorus olitorius]
MGNKKIITEDEKIERTIRALLKHPENKRCINCNHLGPQYVCTTFLTFVCTTCAGIQEFTHRVKSVSMAKFSEEEVNSLQAAGNERAREIYFKAWDPQRHSSPDGSNLHRLRDFIKHVYVDRKYAGERSDRLPNLRLGNRADSSESRKVSIFSGRPKSPLYEDRADRSPNEGSSTPRRIDAVRGYYSERRSPRYAQENTRYGGFRRNPMCIEIVDNRLRDDESRGSRLVSRKNMDRSGSPVVRSLADILGENALTLQLAGHSETNAVRDPEVSATNQVQKSASSGAIVSLIDFSMDSEPSNAETAITIQQVPPSSDGGKQSSDENPSKGKAPPASSANSLELLLFDLSDPSELSVNNVSPVPGTAAAPSTASGQNICFDAFSPEGPSAQALALTTTIGSPTVSSAIDAQQKPSNDLFASSYASAPAGIPGWQTGLPHGMGFGLQYYPNAMHAAAFLSNAKANPFDLNCEKHQEQAPSFPSVASLQLALPSVQASTGLSHTSSFSGMESHSSYLTSLMTPGAYMGNQSHISLPPSRPQRTGDFDSDDFILGSISTIQKPAGGHSASSAPNSFPTMGANPFG